MIIIYSKKEASELRRGLRVNTSSKEAIKDQNIYSSSMQLRDNLSFSTLLGDLFSHFSVNLCMNSEMLLDQLVMLFSFQLFYLVLVVLQSIK